MPLFPLQSFTRITLGNVMIQRERDRAEKSGTERDIASLGLKIVFRKTLDVAYLR